MACCLQEGGWCLGLAVHHPQPRRWRELLRRPRLLPRLLLRLLCCKALALRLRQLHPPLVLLQLLHMPRHRPRLLLLAIVRAAGAAILLLPLLLLRLLLAC
jgi:hypothetical protein